MLSNITRVKRFRGILLGTAVGDSLGLPAEGLSRRRVAKFFKGHWRQRLLLSRGMVSDDTDHAFFVAQSLLAHAESSAAFAKRLAWSFRLWLLGVPSGIGFATLKSILKLWIGFGPTSSGVYSAGNGPAMRSASIGAFFAESLDKVDEYVRVSTRMTHTDSRAEVGARAVAHLTAWIIREDCIQPPSVESFLSVLHAAAPQKDEEWKRALELARNALDKNQPVSAYADALGLSRGVTGYIYHTVPIAAYAWFRHFGHFRDTLVSVLDCGGDTDTVGAVAGALAGATVGSDGIPTEWIEGIWGWPRGAHLLDALGDRLAEKSQGAEGSGPVQYFLPGLLIRSAVFQVALLLHVIRRCLPPY